MSIKDMIIEQYDSIDNFIEETKIEISRTYLYMILHNETVNPSLAVIEELAKALNKEVDEVVKLIYSNRHRD